ncbi:MAG: hypothetical protein DWQ34_11890 [Planctomycetota bacterium]|nr:MAG: hypothetical protein DWQ29_21040 [Planctomycetota bacterium]REJ93014.1 MAG: hypothetical protein DWQ34_11890 [Planctomycetota bacterium]REK28086.1 MAG: hypothetical protein DWQ41_06665 [Planctomycetota bacterium]REK37613.1 MAG: hypothetical protein DWQ45_06350 [Planctomycetota bacterium]
MQRLLLTLIVLAGASRAAADEQGRFVDRVYHDDAGAHKYVVYLPADYSGEKRWPVILYLHGAAGRGNDAVNHLDDGLAPVLRIRESYPAIVVFPQCENRRDPLLECWTASSPDGRRAVEILAEVEREYSIDPERRVLSGWSMGGYGAWSLAAAYPEMWSAVVPLAGGGDPGTVASIGSTPVWAIHGGRDRAIQPVQSEQMVAALQDAGGDAELTVIEDMGHDVWMSAFSSELLLEWMLDPESQPRDSDALKTVCTAFLASGESDLLLGEFKPALIVPRAVSLRLGNDALRTLSYALPEAIPANMLTGAVDDVHFTVEVQGDEFEITLSDLRYTTVYDHIDVEARENGTVHLLVGAKPLELRIGKTTVSGPEHSAEAGPVMIRLGHRRPVWIDLNVRPQIVEGEFDLLTEQITFEIPDDNWMITPPEEVTAEGEGLTPDLVRTGIVGGLYLRREEIEQAIREAVPRTISEAANHLEPLAANSLVQEVWPLPIFKPRLRLQLDDVSVDRDGISIAMAMIAAPSHRGHGPDQPIVVSPIGPEAKDIPRGRQLEIGVAPGLLAPLSQMSVAGDAARVDVRDMPDSAFFRLGDRDELMRVIPALGQLPDDVEIRAEIMLAGPFTVEELEIETSTVEVGPEAGSATSNGLQPSAGFSEEIHGMFHLHRASVVVSVRNSESDEWNHCVRFDVDVKQLATVDIQHMGDRRRIRFGWDGEPEMEVTADSTGALAVNHAEVDLEYFESLMRECWNSWVAETPQTFKDLPDLNLAPARLRLEDIASVNSLMVARYLTPPIFITNYKQKDVAYQVRGPNSQWSRTFTLPPGESHRYDVPYSLMLRRADTPYRVSPTPVPLGTRFEFGREDDQP